MKKGNKLIAIVTSILLVFTLFSSLQTEVNAMGTSNNEVVVNQTKVAFAGETWWVIGDDTTGVNPMENHVTLFATTLKEKYNSQPFRHENFPFLEPDWIKVPDEFPGSDDVFAYEPNPQGMKQWVTANEYAGSNIQRKAEEYANDILLNSADEYALITPRDFIGKEWVKDQKYEYYPSGIAGQSISDQKVWSISEAECITINIDDVRSYEEEYWLRSSDYPYSYHNGFVNARFTNGIGSASANNNYSLRPALSLNVSNALFISDTTAKETLGVGNSFASIVPTTDTIKYTVKSDKQNVEVEVNTTLTESLSDSIGFNYKNATTGSNQYVSAILRNQDGKVVYYGKLADSSTNANGSIEVKFDGIENGKYNLEIFSEKANGSLNTDFASNPYTMEIEVENGKVKLPHTHVFDVQAIEDTYLLQEATCTSKAIYYYSCRCGEKGEETFEYGEVLNHNYATEWTNDETKHWHECDCGAKTDETAHTFEWVVDKPATHLEKGSKHEECSVCGYKKDGVDIPVVEHAFGEDWTNNETHHWHECDCGAKADEATHTFKWVVDKPATHLEKGSKHEECSVCGYKKDGVDIPVVEHTFDKDWTSNETNHWHECDCGAKADEATHTFKWVVDKESTHTEKGSKHEECEICGYEKDSVDIPVIEHTFDKDWTNDDTKHWRECDCGAKADEDIHKFIEVIDKEATHLEKGSKHEECSVCGYKKSSVDIPVVKHTFEKDWTSDNNTHWHKCECGAILDESVHTFKWAVDKEPTKTEKGSKHEECTICGYKKDGVEIPIDSSTNLNDKDDVVTSTKTNEMLWVSILAISGIVFIVIVIYRRKKSH